MTGPLTASAGRHATDVASLARRRRRRVVQNGVGLAIGLGMVVFGVDLEMNRWSWLATRAVVAWSGVQALWCAIRICVGDWRFPLAALLQIVAFWLAYPSW